MKKASVLSVLSAILLTWAVTVGAIFCPITAFRIPAEPLTLILFSGALAILFSILLALRRGWIGLGLLVAALAAFVVVRWEDIAPELARCCAGRTTTFLPNVCHSACMDDEILHLLQELSFTEREW